MCFGRDAMRIGKSVGSCSQSHMGHISKYLHLWYKGIYQVTRIYYAIYIGDAHDRSVRDCFRQKVRL